MVNVKERNEAGELLRLAVESAVREGSSTAITEARRTCEQVVARQKLESLGSIAGGIAHDFNNLLSTILADAELALAEALAGSTCAEEIRHIRTVAIRASEIVRELMNYAGQGESEPEPVDVSLLVEEMLQLLKVSIPKSTLLKTDLNQRLPPVLVNAPQLRQVVMNLILNAAEAMGPEGGVIHVATSRWKPGHKSIGKFSPPTPEGDYVCLEVSDTGPGMSEEVQAKVFEPFFTTKEDGHGLGLAVVKAIVASYGGSIHVTSTPGQGTRFDLLFPVTLATPPNRVAAGLEPANNGPGLSGKVLLVEDEEGLRVAMAKMLRKTGLSVTEASDGWAAMEVIRHREREIDLILLDMNIPGASSHKVFTAAQRIRPEVKILLTTAYRRAETVSSFHGPQVKGFIRKPYQFADLVQLMGKTLAG
jgi:two-component system cell cycle sensor histidine kinase/response regulator CckA